MSPESVFVRTFTPSLTSQLGGCGGEQRVDGGRGGGLRRGDQLIHLRRWGSLPGPSYPYFLVLFERCWSRRKIDRQTLHVLDRSTRPLPFLRPTETLLGLANSMIHDFQLTHLKVVCKPTTAGGGKINYQRFPVDGRCGTFVKYQLDPSFTYFRQFLENL